MLLGFPQQLGVESLTLLVANPKQPNWQVIFNNTGNRNRLQMRHEITELQVLPQAYNGNYKLKHTIYDLWNKPKNVSTISQYNITYYHVVQ